MAPRRDFQRGSVQSRRAVSAQGRQGYIEGQLQTRKWTDQSGAEKYSTEIVLNGYGAVLTMLDGPQSGGDKQGAAKPSYGDVKGGTKPKGAGPLANDMNDDIPFAPEWR